MKVTERLIARHTLTKFLTDCSMRKPPSERRHKQSLPPFVTFAWLEEEIRNFRWFDCENDQNHRVIASFHDERTNVYSICYFGSLILFKHFKVMVREALPPLPTLTARHCLKASKRHPSTPYSHNTPKAFLEERGCMPSRDRQNMLVLVYSQHFSKICWRVPICSVVLRQRRKSHWVSSSFGSIVFMASWHALFQGD